MRQVLAVACGAALAALGAVVLGEYDLRGTTAFAGFPLYAVAVTELALTVAKRLAPLTLAALAAVVAAGLTWALWISFGHFRNDVVPPWSSWAMVAVAAAAALAWGWSGRRRASAGPDPSGPSGPAEREAQGPPAAQQGSGPAARDEEARP